jgi:excisionase family DNA binding protein
MEQKAYTIKEFKEVHRIGHDKTYDEIREGRLRAIKVGRKTLILKTDADQWAANLPALVLKQIDRKCAAYKLVSGKK